MILNKQILTLIYTGLKTAFQETFDQFKEQPDVLKYTREVPSDTESEDYGWIANLPQMRKWIGERHIKMLKAFKYSLVNDDFESTVGVDRNHILDNKMTGPGQLARGLGEVAAKAPWELARRQLALAFSQKCYDGQFFCDTDHPYLDANGQEQMYSNSGGGAGEPWYLIDGSKYLKPVILQMRQKVQLVERFDLADPELFERKRFVFGADGRWQTGFSLPQLIYGSKQPLNQANFDLAYSALTKMPRDGGGLLGCKATLLVVGTANRSAAEAVLEKQYLAGGESNTNYKRVELVVEPELG